MKRHSDHDCDDHRTEGADARRLTQDQSQSGDERRKEQARSQSANCMLAVWFGVVLDRDGRRIGLGGVLEIDSGKRIHGACLSFSTS